MIFNSVDFAIFFVVVFFVNLFLQRNHELQNRFLLVSSFIFYGWWDWRFLFLIGFTIIVDFLIGKAIGAAAEQAKRKRLMLLSVATNLTILGFFKYFNFFIDSTIDLLNLIGIPSNPTVLNIILPVGISFYTFQSMSYVIDIYNKKLDPAKNVFDYATYLSLFPPLIAGPIERGTNLLPQILQPRKITLDNCYEGGYLILWGLFKKVFIADNLAKMVDPVFSGSGEYTGAQILVATYAFAFQIYCDFSGYTDIARGVAKCLGFNLILNFNLPYFSSNPSEFWRRWHISLSSWLRDYLYIALGGNRKGHARTYFNLMATMVLGGLWHGAQWNFIIWGAYQGLLLVSHRASEVKINKIAQIKYLKYIFKPLAILFFFQLVCYGWLIFRAESASQIYDMTIALLKGIDWIEFSEDLPRLLFYILPLFVVQAFQYASNNLNVFLKTPTLVRTLFYLGCFYGVLVFGNFSSNDFIYFQF